MSKTIKFKITNIDYDVNYSDVIDILQGRSNKNSFTDDEIQAEIKSIKKDLPAELLIEVDKSDLSTLPADNDEIIADKISDLTGWCVNSFDYSEYKVKRAKAS